MPPLSSSENLLFGDIAGKSILDIGTGCGVVALVAKLVGARYVIGVDISSEAIINAQTNLNRNFDNCEGIEFRVGDLYESINERFDIIVSNPPYFKEMPKRHRDYKYCGGDLVDRILSDGKSHLNTHGEIRILHPVSSEPSMRKLAHGYGYSFTTVQHFHRKDHRWLRFLLGQTIRPRLKIFIFKLGIS
jgi:methylase of polypeptide subunit release factors